MEADMGRETGTRQTWRDRRKAESRPERIGCRQMADLEGGASQTGMDRDYGDWRAAQEGWRQGIGREAGYGDR